MATVQDDDDAVAGEEDGSGIIINVVRTRGGADGDAGESDGDGDGSAMEGVASSTRTAIEADAAAAPDTDDTEDDADDGAMAVLHDMPDSPSVPKPRRVGPGGDEESWLSFLNQPHIEYPPDVYDPNEIFDQVDQEGDDPAVPRRVRRPRRLAELLLDLDRPELTTRMVDFMLEDGACCSREGSGVWRGAGHDARARGAGRRAGCAPPGAAAVVLACMAYLS